MAGLMFLVLAAVFICYIGNHFTSAMSEAPEHLTPRGEKKRDRHPRCVGSMNDIESVNDLFGNRALSGKKKSMQHGKYQVDAYPKKPHHSFNQWNQNQDRVLANRRGRRHEWRRSPPRKPTTKKPDVSSTTWRVVTIFPEYRARYPNSQRRWYNHNYPRYTVNPDYIHHHYRGKK